MTFKLLAKYLAHKEDMKIKSSINNKPIIIFKVLPPTYSEISKISLP